MSKEHKGCYLRVIPLSRGESGELVDGVQTYVIHTKLEDLRVARVPVTMSVQQAQLVEKQLTDKFGQDVLVLSDNVELCRVEVVSDDEVAKLLKGAA